MHQLVIGSKAYRCPSTWSELQDRQVLRIAPWVFAAVDSPVSRYKVFRELVNAPGKLLRQLTEGQWYDLLACVEWLWKLPMEGCPLPSFPFGKQIFFLPESGFEKVLMGEYALAESHLKSFLADSRQTGHLDKLVATLARPAGANDTGDKREKFSQALTEARAGQLATLPLSIKILVLQYFVAEQRQIIGKYPVLFVTPEKGKNESPSPFDLGWFGMMFDLAEGGVFGSFESVSFTSLHTILAFLTKRHFDNEARKKKYGNVSS